MFYYINNVNSKQKYHSFSINNINEIKLVFINLESFSYRIPIFKCTYAFQIVYGTFFDDNYKKRLMTKRMKVTQASK